MPLRSERDLSKLEAIGMFAGFIGVSYAGYYLGAEAVEYAKKIAENSNGFSDVITYMINMHPSLTKTFSTLGFGMIGGRLGILIGKGIDNIFS
ncbi:MAG: hypothetical protein AABX79_00515 [Nanoarchaeota archaeon]